MRRFFSMATMIVAVLTLFATSASLQAAEIKDGESATHGSGAATYKVVETYKFPGFQLVQFDLAVLSQFSYMVVSDGKALVIDPNRDVAAYIRKAKEEGASIVGVFLTHNNADFVAGHMELAKLTNCPVYISEKAGVGFIHKALKEGSVINVGQANLKCLETPGHTTESMSALLFSKRSPDKPLGIITGDALFVGSVGRPDLMGGHMAPSTLASMMYDTWTNKLSNLPDDVAIFPGHGAGSLCGAHLSDEPTSTIGVQRTANPYLKYTSRGAFIAALLEGLPEAPQYFKHNAAMNKQGPPLVDWEQAPVWIKPDKVLTDPKRNYLVDLRDAKAYAAGHIANSVNIGLRGRLETWTGIMVPWGAKLVLVGSEAEIKEAEHRLHRVGYDKVQALTVDSWQKAGLPIKSTKLITPVELYQEMQRGTAPVVVDVRLPAEWMTLRIGTVLNLPLNLLVQESAKLDPSQPVVAVCNSAFRSSLAMGILERNGFSRATSLDGGSQAWIDAGLPVYGKKHKGGEDASQDAPKREVRLPERISPADLKRRLMDLPGTFDLVDIRPAQHFADFNLTGSRNVDLVDLMHNPAYLNGVGPLIIVDRDGSLAMAIGGILSQKTPRVIQVLHGGLEAYWAESELRPSVGTSKAALPAPAQAKPANPASVPKQTPLKPPPAPPEKPMRKSGGC